MQVIIHVTDNYLELLASPSLFSGSVANFKGHQKVLANTAAIVTKC